MTTTNNHTPNPWHLTMIPNHAGECLTGIIHAERTQTDYCKENPLIATVEHIEAGEGQANARLIAAAPELLDALRECITSEGAQCVAYGADTPAMRRRLAAINETARAAIAKATK